MRPNTRDAVFRAAGAVAGIGREARARFLQAAWQAEPSRAAWATALALGWIGGSSLVIADAGTRDRLRDWFNHADLANPLPFLRRHLVSMSELPERLILFRGGVVESDELRCGYSWTRGVNTAAYYAELRRIEKKGTPVVVRPEVPRSTISMHTRTSDAEVVIVDSPDRVEVHIDCPKEIRRGAEAYYLAVRDVPNDANFLTLSLDDESCWAGWAGDGRCRLEANVS
jgi:hypothetical protein